MSLNRYKCDLYPQRSSNQYDFYVFYRTNYEHDDCAVNKKIGLTE